MSNEGRAMGSAAQGRMSPVAERDPLLRPFQLGHLELRNRIVSTSHAPHYAENGLPLERYRLYHEEKARGGIALTMIGGSSSVDLDSPYLPGYIDLSEDRVILPLRELAAGVHRFGAAVMCQITHRGRRQSSEVEPWLPLISASGQPEPAWRSFPSSMDVGDIQRVTKAFGAAAERCRAAGLDGVEIAAYSDHLLEQFLSPGVNRREDEYGGALANRIRFLHEVVAETRRSVGPDFIVGVRLAVEEGVPEGGIGLDEGERICATVDGWGLVDVLSLTVGSGLTDQGLTLMIPEMGKPFAPYLETIGRIRKSLTLPVMHAARIPDLSTARHAIESGSVDLVGMTRAHIADPYIVDKLSRGEADRIRPCVGAAYCINRTYTGRDALCLHNPATGREAVVPHRLPTSQRRQRIVVIGGGPAGLEAARASAERGHSVMLYEAAERLGGQVRLAARAVTHRAEMLGIVDWLADEARRHGVDLRLGELADAEQVLAESPDVVVVASGGLPRLDTAEETTPGTVSPWDILDGTAPPGDDVCVYDEQGREVGLSVAELLAGSGSRVHLVTPDRNVGQSVVGVTYSKFLAGLYRGGVALRTDHRLVAVEVGRAAGALRASFRNVYTDDVWVWEGSQLVVERGLLPVTDVFDVLVDGSANGGKADLRRWVAGQPQDPPSPGGYLLYKIGDAAAHRNIHAAIYDGRRVALSLA